MAISQVTPSAPSHDPTHHGSSQRQQAGEPERPVRHPPTEEQAATAGDRRRFRRIPSSGLRVAIDGTEYPVLDLSVGGFRVRPYTGTLQSGEQFALRFRVLVSGSVAEFRGRGKVLRRDGDDLTAVYATNNPKFYQGLMRYIAQEAALRLSYHGTAKSSEVSDPAFLETSA
ncbi:MAG: PilZ domain-containing protein [Rhodospirillaceae bacterium]|nr:PilZ domain-containing protein [Rhodospirillaceae bacterium]